MPRLLPPHTTTALQKFQSFQPAPLLLVRARDNLLAFWEATTPWQKAWLGGSAVMGAISYALQISGKTLSAGLLALMCGAMMIYSCYLAFTSERKKRLVAEERSAQLLAAGQAALDEALANEANTRTIAEQAIADQENEIADLKQKVVDLKQGMTDLKSSFDTQIMLASQANELALMMTRNTAKVRAVSQFSRLIEMSEEIASVRHNFEAAISDIEQTGRHSDVRIGPGPAGEDGTALEGLRRQCSRCDWISEWDIGNVKSNLLDAIKIYDHTIFPKSRTIDSAELVQLVKLMSQHLKASANGLRDVIEKAKNGTS